MKGSKEVMMEDWERVSLMDTIYLYDMEEELRREEEWNKWLSLHEGKVIIETDEETGEERKEIVISSTVLPF